MQSRIKIYIKLVLVDVLNHLIVSIKNTYLIIKEKAIHIRLLSRKNYIRWPEIFESTNQLIKK